MGTGGGLREGGIVPRVLLFFDYTCPFCYVDSHRFSRLRREREVEVVPCPLELRPDLPAEGLSVEELGGGHSERVEAYLLRTARREGFPMRLPEHVPNTHAAMVLGEVARDGGAETHWRVHMGVFHAYYGEEADIGARDVLLTVAGKEGLDEEAVTAAWEGGLYDERLDAFGNLAAHLGIQATPAAIICNELVIGSRPYGVIAEAVERCMLRRDAAEAEPEEVSSTGEDAATDNRRP
ncbi:MAG: DsbA family protein [Coriobacteriia bacterium]|nr:DsbA family protein [Coriobacteriia bacterium]